MCWNWQIFLFCLLFNCHSRFCFCWFKFCHRETLIVFLRYTEIQSCAFRWINHWATGIELNRTMKLWLNCFVSFFLSEFDWKHWFVCKSALLQHSWHDDQRWTHSDRLQSIWLQLKIIYTSRETWRLTFSSIWATSNTHFNAQLKKSSSYIYVYKQPCRVRIPKTGFAFHIEIINTIRQEISFSAMVAIVSFYLFLRNLRRIWSSQLVPML